MGLGRDVRSVSLTMRRVFFPATDRTPQQQQPGFGLIDPSAYTVGLQPQFTAIQPQFTAFNPYQQQAQQEAMQVRSRDPSAYLKNQ
jgi:hypothetical protein